MKNRKKIIIMVGKSIWQVAKLIRATHPSCSGWVFKYLSSCSLLTTTCFHTWCDPALPYHGVFNFPNWLAAEVVLLFKPSSVYYCRLRQMLKWLMNVCCFPHGWSYAQFAFHLCCGKFALIFCMESTLGSTFSPCLKWVYVTLFFFAQIRTGLVHIWCIDFCIGCP